ncbi:pol protein [Gossypium australe]|uniref:Pol protein n=1 Tax=Gossypium australe TaxID=47621 RepID=A0A5B6UVS4_9ROSI|nr:pol protein [Gossypium australe]
MKRETCEFVVKCLICQHVKAKHQVERVTMDFVSGLPITSKKKDSISVIVHRLTKSTHFIPVRTYFSLERLAELYIYIYISEISKLHEALGTKLNFSTAFHPQTDGQLERVIQILEDMLRCCILEFKDCLKAASNHQKSHVDLKRKDIEFAIGDRVFLKVSTWKKVLRFSRKRKLSLRFIRPYEIVERISPVAYRLGLPFELEKIPNVFHVSMLRWYRSDPSYLIPHSEIELQSYLTYSEKLIRILTWEVKELRNK